MSIKYIYSFLLLIILTACKVEQKNTDLPDYTASMKTSAELSGMKNNFKKYLFTITGRFESEAKESDKAAREMVVRRIFTNKTDEVWTYTEVFLKELPEQPFIQLFHRHERLSRDTFRVEIYTLAQPENLTKYVNEWKKPQPFPALSPRALQALPGCPYRVVNQNDAYFETLVEEEVNCVTPLGGGIHYSKSNLQYHDDHVLLKVSYFDKEKKSLPSPSKDGTTYNRVSLDLGQE